MYARVTTFQVQPDQLADALQTSNEVIVPVMRQQAGFRGYTEFLDRTSGKALSLTFWSSEADLAASETNGFYREAVAKLAAYVTAQPTREVFEVSSIELQQHPTMYVRMTTFQVRPGQLADALQTGETVVRSVLRQQAGFRGVAGLVDHARDTAIALTFWDSTADIAASDSNGYYREQIAKLAPYVTAQPTREVYEVGIVDLQQ